MKRIIVALVLLAAFFVAGCTALQTPSEDQTPTTDGATVTGLQEDLTGLDTLDEELDISDLEGIEDDLNVDF